MSQSRKIITRNKSYTKIDSIPRQSGFTLVESMVAVSIFAIAITSVVGSFIAITRIDEKSRGIRAVSQNTRFVSEYLTREIRNGYIRYAAYGSSVPNGPITNLYLNDHSGVPIDITLSGGKLRLTRGGSTTDLTGADVTVTSFNVWIKPSTDPYPGGTSSQPLVTFNMTLRSNLSIRPNDQTTVLYQTSVSTRYYGG